MTDDFNQATVAELEPAGVWRFFAGLASVPRPSKKEERVRAHVRRLAEDAGFAARELPGGSLLIEVPASKGLEDAPTVVLQAHLDMVCEKNKGTVHDFDNDPLKLVIDNDGEHRIVRADGTTLGADNGIGVALALAAAVDPQLEHGPLELLLTTDEEAGMSGAKAVTPDSFKGRRMLNLDGEDDEVIYIGCAGGCDTNLSWNLPRTPIAADESVVRVSVTGLRGGHSGGDIHLNRGNANQLLARTILAARMDGLRIVEINGGAMRNAIPREATAVVAGPSAAIEALHQAAQRLRKETVAQSTEPDATILVEPVTADRPESAVSDADTDRVLKVIDTLPNGVIEMSPDLPDLVQTSNNISTIQSSSPDSNTLSIVIGMLSRSSSAGSIQALLDRIAAVGGRAGAEIKTGNPYPGWMPDVKSPTLAVCKRVFERLFDTPPQVMAVHAGLECGVIGEALGPNEPMDMISFGPRIEGAHTPDERVYIESVKKSWRFLTASLAELARE